MRRWIGIGAVAAAAVVALVMLASSTAGNGSVNGSGDGTLEFEEVMVRDLEEITTLDGTLGFPEGDPVISRLKGTITDVATSGSTVAEGQVLFTVDGEPVVYLQGTLPAFRDIGSDPVLLTLTAQDSGVITSVPDVDDVLRYNSEAFRIDEVPVVVLAGDFPAWRDLDEGYVGTDVEQFESALDVLGYGAGALTVDEYFSEFTDSVARQWQEDVGLPIDGRFDLEDAFFAPTEPVVVELLVGVGDAVSKGTPVMVVRTQRVAGSGLTVDSDAPSSAADVLQLQEALVRLGYSVPTNGVVGSETAAGIVAWQSDLGAEVDGVVDLGEVIFLPEPVRVIEASLTIGSPVSDGSAVLATSSSSSVVLVDLPADDQDLLEVGLEVIVEMPNGTEVPAIVTEISGIAVRNAAGDVVFETTIELIDETVGADLDQAPVDVLVVTDSRSQVLSVPVTALLALAEGGYAVEVEQPDGSVGLVGVEPGLYADGWVEVTTDGLAAGDLVVVP
jgi:peptidoglycan hydrolase-like protein with peptidoglycan-binding domain